MNKLITTAASVAAITLGLVNESLETRVDNLESLAIRQIEHIEALQKFDDQATELLGLHGSNILENRNGIAEQTEVLSAAGDGFQRHGKRLDRLESTYLRSMAIDWVFMDILTTELSIWMQRDQSTMSEVELRMLYALVPEAKQAKKDDSEDV